MLKVAVYGKGGIKIHSDLTCSSFCKYGKTCHSDRMRSERIPPLIHFGGEPLRPVMTMRGKRTRSRMSRRRFQRKAMEESFVLRRRLTPGLGCAGRGIIATFQLEDMELFEHYKPDVVLYDVLGDVVCGGFVAPIREGYADKVLIVTSGENGTVCCQQYFRSQKF